MERQVRENVLLLRNKENCKANILINNVSLTGIKDRCVWNELRNYYAIN